MCRRDSYIDAIGEDVQITLARLSQVNLHRYPGTAAGGNGHLAMLHIAGVGESILLLREGTVLIGHKLDAVLFIDPRSQDRGVQLIALRLVSKVMDVERVAVASLPAASQLTLGGLAIDVCEVAQGRHSRLHIGKAGALTSGAVQHAVGVPQGHSRTHKQRIHQLTLAVGAQVLKYVGSFHTLQHAGSDTRHVGAGHGGAAAVAVAAVRQRGVDLSLIHI